MISTIREILRYINEGGVNIWLIALVYFWSIWFVKIVCSRLYKPVQKDFFAPMSVIVPTYHEDKDILSESVERILKYSKEIVTEVIVVTDQREKDVAQFLITRYADEQRLHVIVSPPGKREAVDAGVRFATNEIVSVIESDTFVDEKTLYELIKPFNDPKVGGTVGDQRIYRPYDSLVNFFNTLVESTKYNITIPALSLFGCVTVLGGRCVAYRKSVILPLLPDLINEKFLGKKCISGDDGRLTSLMLKAGCRCVYQSTAIAYTVSPPSWYVLMRQRLRWHRNTSRRTIRALTCWDGVWAWKRPVIALQMIFVWTNTIMMTLIIYALIMSIKSGNWFWFGRTYFDIFARIALLLLGITLTRIIRVYPILKYHNTRKWSYFPLFPWYLTMMWLVRLYAIFTMNKQGWITRSASGAGGFSDQGQKVTSADVQLDSDKIET